MRGKDGTGTIQCEFISIQNKEPGATGDVMAPEIARGIPLPVYMNF